MLIYSGYEYLQTSDCHMFRSFQTMHTREHTSFFLKLLLHRNKILYTIYLPQYLLLTTIFKINPLLFFFRRYNFKKWHQTVHNQATYSLNISNSVNLNVLRTNLPTLSGWTVKGQNTDLHCQVDGGKKLSFWNQDNGFHSTQNPKPNPNNIFHRKDKLSTSQATHQYPP